MNRPNSSGLPPNMGRIGLAVLLAATVAPLLSTMVNVLVAAATATAGGYSSAASQKLVIFFFLCHIVFPFAFGIWAGIAWPSRRAKGQVFLSSAVALLYLMFFGLFVIPVFGFGSIWGLVPLMYTITTVALFTAGGYFGDFLKEWRSSTKDRESGTALKLILTLGPGIIGLITALIPLISS